MWNKLKPRYRMAAIGIGVVLLLVIGRWVVMDSGIVPRVAGMGSQLAGNVELPEGDVQQGAPEFSYELTAQPQANFAGCVNLLSIPWNGTTSLNLANGGPRTAARSLMREYSGGCLNIERQDDYAVMREQMVRFAQSEHREGAAITVIMGDALPSFMAATNEALSRYNEQAVVVGVVGFSYGEDKCMGRPLNGDPQSARGSLIAAVRMDGDQNTCIKWASDNDIPINVDQTTYDPNAINFLDSSSFVEAGEKYMTGFCEDRNVLGENGLPTGQRQNVCVDGVATWTPGDVTVAEFIAREQRSQHGPNGREPRAIVSWASTREYNQQMPTVLIANKQWAAANRQFIVGMLRAADRAAFQIRTDGGASLRRASEINANIFGENGRYWARYFVGEDFEDTQGNTIRLGGSRVITLAESRDFLGQGEGTLNVYQAVYNTFCGVYVRFYPRDLSECPAYESVVDASYTMAALGEVQVGNTGPTYQEGSITDTVSQRSYSIEFDVGRATIRRESLRQLFEIAEGSGMTNLRIRIDGHTDATGGSDANMALSRARAQAVADWLHSQAASTFPRERLQVRGYGDTQPLCEQSTPSCYQRNRRVEIVLGN